MLVVFWLAVLSTATKCYCDLDPNDDWVIPVNEKPKTQNTSSVQTFVVKKNVLKRSVDSESSGQDISYSTSINVDTNPAIEPPCMLPSNAFTSSGPRDVPSNIREVLTFEDLTSDTVQLAVQLAQIQFMAESMSELRITKLLGGCKQYISGYLYYLMFKAIETIPCERNFEHNCTGVVKLYHECRARVHTTYLAPWNPFFVECKSPAYYALPWRRITS
uniref:uncharacterized protein LOC101242814 isoform X2 n=1 Tax=Ciona intestinalis TaxID=7719 RepID=UPI0002B8D990|nr:uncharacterized protein LOC101242814 isoform X2 [Ciona intestinalis]|eukprot:XP_004225642.1 uncharacterized protein LOC101242814 isoform X2 [Ciona intestinalis]